MLPPEPREYWKALAAEHHAAPAHQSWMYDADPFAARQAVSERQATAEKKQEDVRSGKAAESAAAKEFADQIEVKMATELRSLVESAIQKVEPMAIAVGLLMPTYRRNSLNTPRRKPTNRSP